MAINIAVANFKEDLIYPTLLHLIIYSFYIFSFILCLNLKNALVNKFFITIAAAYYLQYFFLDLSDILEIIIPLSLNKLIIYLISALAIFTISYVFTQQYFSSSNQKSFLVIALLVCLSQIGILGFNVLNSLPASLNKDIEQNTHLLSPSNTKDLEIIGENVYYIILDGLTSYNNFKEISSGKDDTYSEFNSELQRHKFHLSANSFASYNTTHLTLASIFNMDYYDDDFTYPNRDQFFPQMLYKNNPPKLIKNLQNIGYKFIYSGNLWSSCKKSTNVSCANRTIDTNQLNIFEKFAYLNNNAGINSYTSRSLLGYFLRKYSSYFNLLISDDGLDSFLGHGVESIKPFTKNFYFIHNLAPHPPYFDQNCKINNTEVINGWGSKGQYLQSLACTFKKTLFSINKILELDSSAIIIIQGDHGPGFSYDFLIDPKKNPSKSLIERFAIGNFIRLPSRCDSSMFNSMGNIETINLVFSCISNMNNMKIENRSFAGSYENNKEFFGKLIEVTENLN